MILATWAGVKIGGPERSWHWMTFGSPLNPQNGEPQKDMAFFWLPKKALRTQVAHRQLLASAVKGLLSDQSGSAPRSVLTHCVRAPFPNIWVCEFLRGHPPTIRGFPLGFPLKPKKGGPSKQRHPKSAPLVSNSTDTCVTCKLLEATQAADETSRFPCRACEFLGSQKL